MFWRVGTMPSTTVMRCCSRVRGAGVAGMTGANKVDLTDGQRERRRWFFRASVREVRITILGSFSEVVWPGTSPEGSRRRGSGHFSSPSHLRRSIIDPPTFRKYRLSHCFPSISTDAVSREIKILVYMRPVTMTISPGSCWLLVRVGLELRVVANSKCWADCRERTNPRGKVREAKQVNNRTRTKIGVVLRSLSYLARMASYSVASRL